MTLAEAFECPGIKKTWFWVWSALPVIVLLEFQAVAPLGHWSLLYFELPYLLGILVATFAVGILPFGLFRRASRVVVLAWLILAVAYISLAIGGLVLGSWIRSHGFQRLALRSAPLVSAIRAYAEDHGRPPSTLGELVPRYLPRVPSTGMMAYPDYRYYVGTNAASYEGNPWALVVHAPSGGINFDKFIYFPMQNYPTRGYGGSLERVEDWAYVHE